MLEALQRALSHPELKKLHPVCPDDVPWSGGACRVSGADHDKIDAIFPRGSRSLGALSLVDVVFGRIAVCPCLPAFHLHQCLNHHADDVAGRCRSWKRCRRGESGAQTNSQIRYLRRSVLALRFSLSGMTLVFSETQRPGSNIAAANRYLHSC